MHNAPSRSVPSATAEGTLSVSTMRPRLPSGNGAGADIWVDGRGGAAVGSAPPQGPCRGPLPAALDESHYAPTHDRRQGGSGALVTGRGGRRVTYRETGRPGSRRARTAPSPAGRAGGPSSTATMTSPDSDGPATNCLAESSPNQSRRSGSSTVSLSSTTCSCPPATTPTLSTSDMAAPSDTDTHVDASGAKPTVPVTPAK